MGTRRTVVASPQYVILAAAPRSMPSAEITFYKPTYRPGKSGLEDKFRLADNSRVDPPIAFVTHKEVIRQESVLLSHGRSDE